MACCFSVISVAYSIYKTNSGCAEFIPESWGSVTSLSLCPLLIFSPSSFPSLTPTLPPKEVNVSYLIGSLKDLVDAFLSFNRILKSCISLLGSSRKSFFFFIIPKHALSSFPKDLCYSLIESSSQ